MAKGSRLMRGWRFLRDLFREYEATGCGDSAASLTFTTLFAVVPVLTVAFALLQLTPQLADLGGRIEALIFENFVPATGQQVKAYLILFARQAANLTTLGILFLLVTAIMMLVTVERALNRIWRVHRQRQLLKSLLVYWALLTLGPLLLGSGIAASTYLLDTRVLSHTVNHLSMTGGWLSVVPFLLGALFFSVVYITMPNCDVPVKEGVIGGFVASALLEVGRQGFTFFVTRFSTYELVYGAFAAVPLFLLWVYISWSITLFGMVLVYSLANWDDEEVQEATTFPALLSVLALFHRRQASGAAVNDRDARHAAAQAGIENWNELREALFARQVLGRTATGQLVLVRDLHAMTLAELARVLSWQQLDARTHDGHEPSAFAQAEAARLQEACRTFDAHLSEPVAAAIERLDAPGRA